MKVKPTAVVLTLLALGGCGPAGPAIQEISPSKGQQNVAGDAPLRIVFNHEMDRASVESRFTLSPAIAGCDHVSCPLAWNGRALVQNHPLHPFAPDTQYRVTLRAGYRDAASHTAGADHFWDFRSEGAPSISAVTPADGTAGAAVDGDISIQLSRQVQVPAPMELTLTADDDPGAVDYRVAVAADDHRRLVLSPLSLLLPQHGYRLRIGAGLFDVHHNAIGSPREVHFTTGSLGLTRSLAFLVRDQVGQTSSRVALLRPPAGVNAPAPSLRILYRSDQPIRSFGWSSDSTVLFALGEDGRVTSVGLDGTPAADSGLRASALVPSPGRQEVALVTEGALHLWRPGTSPAPDVPVAQAGQVVGAPSWSGDGRRLAVVAGDGTGAYGLRIVDRETLSVSDVPGGRVPAGGSIMAWTVDGSALAFSSGDEVMVYRPLAAQGNGLMKLGTLRASALAWSSDGGTLFAAGSPSADRPMLLHRAPGQPVDGQATGFTPIAGSREGDSQAAAPAFDRRVAFVRPAAGVPQLWIMNNDGTGITQLTFSTYDVDQRLVTDGVEQPRWSPGPAR